MNESKGRLGWRRRGDKLIKVGGACRRLPSFSMPLTIYYQWGYYIDDLVIDKLIVYKFYSYQGKNHRILTASHLLR